MTTETQPNMPEIGMGATILVGSDRYAATVHRITKHSRPIVVGVIFDYQKDYESPEVFYFRETTQRSCGWEAVEASSAPGRWRKVTSGRWLTLGKREDYRDPSF